MSDDNILDPENTAKGLLGLTGITYGGQIAKKVVNDPHFKQRSLEQMNNFLDGFYKQGRLPPSLFKTKQGALAISEGAKGMGRLIADAASYSRGVAHRETGLGLSSRNLFRDYLNMIDNVRTIVQEQLAKFAPDSEDYRNIWRKGNRNVNTIIRKMNAKMTNDYANELLLDPKGSRKFALRNRYISGQWAKQKRSRIPLVEKTSKAAAVKALGKEEVSVLKHIWDIKPNADGKVVVDGWAKYRNIPGLQDVMHGAKFHRPFYHTVLGLNIGEPSYEKFIQSAYNNKLITDKSKNFYQLSNKPGARRLAISFSPSMKPNYDWGGYNVMAIYDESTNKLKLVASDKRDLFHLNLNKQVLNYTDTIDIDPKSYKKQADKYFAKEGAYGKIGISPIDAEVKGDSRSLGNKGVSKTANIQSATGKSYARKIGTKDAIAVEIEKMVDKWDDTYAKETVNKSAKNYRKAFVRKRAMIGKGLLGGIGGAISLAFLAKDLYDEFKK